MRCLLILLLWITPLVGLAEIHKCGAVWTNQDCAVSSQATPLDLSQREKEKIISDLNRFAEIVRAAVGHVDFEADGVAEFCRKPDSSIAECRLRALHADKSLLASYQTLSRIKQRDAQLRQQQEQVMMRAQQIGAERNKKVGQRRSRKMRR